MFLLFEYTEESTDYYIQMHLFYMITDNFNQARKCCPQQVPLGVQRLLVRKNQQTS